MRCSKIKCAKKRMKEISEMREGKKWMNAGGVQQVLRGVQKINEAIWASRGEGRAGFAGNGSGLTHEPWVGSEEVYKGFETHFLSFLKIFLSLPFSNSRFSLFSLLPHSSSPTRRAVVGGKSDAAAARWPAVLDGGGAAANVFFSFFTFPSLSSTRL